MAVIVVTEVICGAFRVNLQIGLEWVTLFAVLWLCATIFEKKAIQAVEDNPFEYLSMLTGMNCICYPITEKPSGALVTSLHGSLQPFAIDLVLVTQVLLNRREQTSYDKKLRLLKTTAFVVFSRCHFGLSETSFAARDVGEINKEFYYKGIIS